MKASILGSVATTAGYTIWVQTLSFTVLVVTLISGLLTASYTIWKWRKDARKSS